MKKIIKDFVKDVGKYESYFIFFIICVWVCVNILIFKTY